LHKALIRATLGSAEEYGASQIHKGVVSQEQFNA
jgi:hypothetical protein